MPDMENAPQNTNKTKDLVFHTVTAMVDILAEESPQGTYFVKMHSEITFQQW